MKNISRSLSIS